MAMVRLMAFLQVLFFWHSRRWAEFLVYITRFAARLENSGQMPLLCHMLSRKLPPGGAVMGARVTTNGGAIMNSKRVFVPLTDEVLYRHPEWIAEGGALTPFNAGLPCYRWLAEQGGHAAATATFTEAAPTVRPVRRRGGLLPARRRRLPFAPAYGT